MTASATNRGPRSGLFFTVTALALGLGLSGCGLFKKDPLECPAVAVVSGTGTLTMFQDGPGRDTSDIVFRAEIGNVSLSCKKTRGGLRTSLTFDISAYGGPADVNQTASVPFFVAVTLGNERVLSKRIFSSEHYFPSVGDVSSFSEEVIEFIPLFEGRVTRDYEILVGIQVTPENLEYNLLH